MAVQVLEAKGLKCPQTTLKITVMVGKGARSSFNGIAQ
jgi:hypothetical protein